MTSERTSAFFLSSLRAWWEMPEKSLALSQIMKLRKGSRATFGRTTLRILRSLRRVPGPPAERRLSRHLIIHPQIVVWEHLSPKTSRSSVRPFAALRSMTSVSMLRLPTQ